MFQVYDPRVVIEDTIKQGGGSFTLDGDGVSFDSGYMVALYGYEYQITLPDCMSPQFEPSLYSVIGQYMQHVNRIFREVDELEKEMEDALPLHYIGTWTNDGTIYLDVVVNVEERDLALFIARQNKQLAIWDCVNQCEIRAE